MKEQFKVIVQAVYLVDTTEEAEVFREEVGRGLTELAKLSNRGGGCRIVIEGPDSVSPSKKPSPTADRGLN